VKDRDQELSFKSSISKSSKGLKRSRRDSKVEEYESDFTNKTS
jgi:hypothetical protein